MLPLNLSFRQLVRKYIPQVSHDNLNTYENLLGLRHQLYQEQRILGHIQKKYPPVRPKKLGTGTKAVPAQPDRQVLMASLTSEADKIFENHDRAFAAANRLWIARRQFALEQGHWLQIPTTWESLRCYLKAYKNYRQVQLATWPTLWGSKIQNFIQSLTVGKIVSYVLLIAIVIVALVAITLKYH